MDASKLETQRRTQPWKRVVLIGIVAVMMVGHYLLFPPDPSAEMLRKGRPVTDTPSPTRRADAVVVPQMTIRDQEGRIVFQGDIDLSATVRRIQDGERLEFPHDGSVFENRERKLPAQRRGHYREYVHPTPRLKGPGPQRIVRGQSREWYYTPDHYETFYPLTVE